MSGGGHWPGRAVWWKSESCAWNAQQIAALKGRLSRTLPPSYRSFLATPNGFQQQSPFIQRLYGADEADWFGSRKKAWAEAYRDTYPNLAWCVRISDVGDSALVLLNPDTASPDGEWQAYFSPIGFQAHVDIGPFASLWRKS
jgi:hypothetical protein